MTVSGAPVCEHGYQVNDRGVHLATGGVCIPADPARDARVAARRAADARKAAAGLDRLLDRMFERVDLRAYSAGWQDGYEASEEQHNRHYVIPECTCADPSGLSGCEQHMPVKPAEAADVPACPPWCGVDGPKCAGPQHNAASS